MQISTRLVVVSLTDYWLAKPQGVENFVLDWVIIVVLIVWKMAFY